MIQPRQLETWCTELLDAGRFDDYCPNGLQIEGRKSVSKLISGVTACQALIDQAIEKKADAILVHHGFFWKGEKAVITGIKAQRIRALMQHDISLIVYHLPLDAHPDLGNNAQLAKRLGFSQTEITDVAQGLLWRTRLDDATAPQQLAATIEKALQRSPLHITAARNNIQTIGWCTGAAQGYIDQAAMLGLDAYISGEISENTVHTARELDIHYFAAGHHATERYGVQALGELIAAEFGIEHQFIDIDNPV